jgi:putative ABC transport system ATP-binding protein
MIELKDVTRKYGDLAVLKEVSFRVEQGEWVTVTGPSGSGKTTLLNLVSGLDRPSKGEILVDGKDVSALPEKEACRFRLDHVGFIFQKYHLVRYLSAMENVMLAQHFHSVHDEIQAREMLEKVGLADRVHHRPGQLSGGEQQRVCIARALINEPSLILADEPTGNLDRANSVKLLEILKTLHEAGGFTIIMVTHDPLVERWAQRVLTLEDGRLVGDRRAEDGKTDGTDADPA